MKAKRTKLIMLMFCIMWTKFTYAQDTINSIISTWQRDIFNPESKFYDIQKKLNNYFEIENDTAEGGGKNMFKRWEYYWQGRTGKYNDTNSGSFINYRNAMLNVIQNQLCVPPYLSGANWELIGPYIQSNDNKNGIVTSIFSDGSRIFAGTNASGLWKSNDNGVTWNCLTDNARYPGLGIQSIIVHSSGQTILAATGFSTFGRGYGIGVIKSTNGGVDWQITNFPSIYDVNCVFKIIEDPDNSSVIYAITEKMVFKSSDEGSNWSALNYSQSNSNMILNDIELTYDNNSLKRIYIAGKDQNAYGGGAEIWMSENDGSTWNIISNNLVGYEQNNIFNGTFEDVIPLNGWSNVNWSKLSVSGTSVAGIIPTTNTEMISQDLKFGKNAYYQINLT